MDGNTDQAAKMGVLGIALVMEEVGRGARLVFRYPASPPPYFNSRGDKHASGNGATDANAPGKTTSPRTSHTNSKSQQKETSASIDLFFDLPARVISKLFRPKRPLCGQPLTLNVSGTTFCCRAELFDNSQVYPSTVGDDVPEHPLVLFSVIVALAPLSSSQSIPTTTEGSSSAKSPRSAHHHSNHKTNTSITTDKHVRNDSTFTTIERIHRNLARLCKVLTREERRNQYVTLQCQMLLSVRKEYEDRFLPTSEVKSSGAHQSNSVKPDDSISNNTRRISNTSISNVGGTPKDKRAMGQPQSGSTTTAESKTDKKGMPAYERREYIQQVIELMFATSHPATHGNLARELADVFHFLSKHDDPACPVTTSSTLSRASGRDGIIYINKHVAVQLDSVDSLAAQKEHTNLIPKTVHEKNEAVNPNLTLLFRNLSPSEIIRGISEEHSLSVGSSSSGADISASVSVSQSMRRMLSQLHPRKSLKEVALDSALSLQRVLEAAKWLVDSDMCVMTLPITRKSRHVCVDGITDKMRALSLPFWQAFSSKSQNIKFHFAKKSVVTGVPHIFMIVSALTSNLTGTAEQKAPRLGDVIDVLTDAAGDQESGALSSNPFRFERPLSLGSIGTSTQREDSTPEDVIYSMTVWLVANGVITQVGQ